MNFFTPRLTAVLFLVLTIGMACSKFDDLDVGEREAEFAIPLFSTEVSLQDVLENFDSTTFITVDADNNIVMNYKGDITARNSLDIFETLRRYDNLPLPVLDTLFALPFDIPNGLDIDFGVMKSGMVDWKWLSDHQEDIQVTVTFPNVTDPDGNVFTHVEDRKYSGTQLISIQGPFDLTGYTIRPEQDSFYVRYQVYRKDAMYNDTLSVFLMTIRDFTGSYVEGYLGQELYEIDRDTIEIDFFENWTRGDVYFADPKIKLTVQNSFGFPVRSKTNLVNVISFDGSVLPLRSDFIQNGINIDYPDFNQVGETIETVFFFNKDNSNIDSIVSFNPVAVDYDLDALPNPDGDTTIRGFVTDSSFFKSQVEVELPIYGKAVGFTAFDTIDVSFSEYDEVTKAEFKIISENEMPLQVDLQILFANSNNEVIDSLFQNQIAVIAPADVDGDGNSLGAKENINFVEMGTERFSKIRSANRAFVRASFSTTNNGQESVRVLANQSVSVRMGMKLGLVE